MKLFILFGQRKESYVGENAPEALEVMDEYGFDENAKWLEGKRKEYAKQSDFESVQIIPVQINQDEIVKRLRPNKEAILGKIV